MNTRPIADPLAELLTSHRAPPVPDGLVERVVARAAVLPQEPALGAVRSGRRGRVAGWVRRPLIAGAVALTLAVSGAVAANLAGVPLPKSVEKIIADLPLGPSSLSPKEPAPARVERSQGPARQKVAPQAAPEQPPQSAAIAPVPGSIDERIQRAREVVAARRAAGLSTPRADRIERAIKAVEARRAAGLVTPNADRIERAIERRRALEREGVDPAALDRRQPEAFRAEVARRLAIRRELLRRARAGDPEAIALVEAHRRQQQERRERWRSTPDTGPTPPLPPVDAPEGLAPEPR